MDRRMQLASIKLTGGLRNYEKFDGQDTKLQKIQINSHASP